MMKKTLLTGVFLFPLFVYSQVGINTNTSKKTLHVNGSLQVTNELNVGGNATTAGNAGTSGQILSSNGAGAAPTWKSVLSKRNYFECILCTGYYCSRYSSGQYS
ncbi:MULTISPECIES: hypothetical protein [Chryseobacterium]|uniref:Uncharacterized protein n=1 Tax=Chryseobacterium geocarposphaerae TaxID=1416776 RepID=A0ABU1LB39_9FLAO|nr:MULTISPECIES: hypothetical protein [Chryseobacterium]MDR6403907.1 hypothetical protein [Chryseobacterium geocarposphaerae]MDR6698574.1 hypothetical protein [Chryseobacterium ginsenosidimutans]